MEKLIHYVWKHKLFPLAQLATTDGQSVEVIDVGLPNSNAGPDFFNAKVKIDGTLWVGNVEIHDKASDWFTQARHRRTLQQRRFARCRTGGHYGTETKRRCSATACAARSANCKSELQGTARYRCLSALL